MNRFASQFKTAFGWAAVVFDDKKRIEKFILPSSRHYATPHVRGIVPGSFPVLEKLVGEYFAGKKVDFREFEFNLDGCPPFHQKVYRRLSRLPFGKVVTYSDIARMLKNPNAARAVGQAMMRNRIPLMIPCHRVINASGAIGKFSAEGGTGLKRKMLELEGVET